MFPAHRARELDPFWDVSGRHPYLIEWPTVIAAAWLGGIGPGLVADTLATFFFTLSAVDDEASPQLRRHASSERLRLL